ncbi:MAG: hypothetical protein B7Y36_00015 [Novosphingobium sp. 28-62-57]|nr:sterol desaturase family protein [Novosphingobium sp. 28-62-57]OYZ11990.1 MAG: hypothetical protein B7Y36_00015 [Novosphingobium sp. 28-62-57]
MSFVESNADRLAFVVCAGLILVPLEHLLPRRKGQTLRRAGLKLDISYMLFGALGTMLVSAGVIALCVTLFSGLVPEAVKSLVRTQPVWAQVIALIVVGDLYYYWAHRLFHTVPALWKFHAVHHSIEEMDWVAAHRTQRHGLCDLQPAVCVPFAAQAFECCGGMGLVALALCHADISSLASCQRCTCP